ncbi:MAG TPA: serine/threonine-protein kinase [Patescibacteria group bacterium]|nr:serine/threonine-protein kinase [Patescibacteria group bacterium]
MSGSGPAAGALDRRVLRLLEPRFDLGPTIGRGSYGCVVRAHDQLLQRDVAIKLIDAPTGGSGAVARLLREARTASAAGPSAVVVHDVLADDAGVAVVMELLRRGSLVGAIRAGTSPRRARTIGEAVVRSMASVHRAGVLHLDLHPGNLLIRDDDTVAIGDFGLAQFARTAGLSRGGHELNWTAPELLGYGVATPQADVYALGLVLAWIGRRAGLTFGPSVERATHADPKERQRDAVELLGDLTHPAGEAGTEGRG